MIEQRHGQQAICRNCGRLVYREANVVGAWTIWVHSRTHLPECRPPQVADPKPITIEPVVWA